MPYHMPEVSIQLKCAVHVPLFLVLRSYGAVVCSDAGGFAFDEVVTVRNKYLSGGCWLPATAAQKERNRKNEGTATPYSS